MLSNLKKYLSRTHIRTGIIFILVVVIAVIALYADFPFNLSSLTGTENHENIKGDRVLSTAAAADDKQDKPEIVFKKAQEYLQSRNFDKALESFIDLEVEKEGTPLGKLATIYHGITLIDRGEATQEVDDFYKAQLKLQELLSKYNDIPSEYSNEFITFLLAMSRVSRQLKTADFDLRPHLENALIYFKDATKSRIYAELGFQEYYQKRFDQAIRYFQKSSDALGTMGLIQTYLAVNQMDKARLLCEEFAEFKKNDEMYDEVCILCDNAFKNNPYFDFRRVVLDKKKETLSAEEKVREPLQPSINKINLKRDENPVTTEAKSDGKDIKPAKPVNASTKPCSKCAMNRATSENRTPSHTQPHGIPHETVALGNSGDAPGMYSICMGSFSQYNNALSRKNVLTEELRIPCVIKKDAKQSLYRIYTYECVQKVPAESLCHKLKDYGFEAYKTTCNP